MPETRNPGHCDGPEYSKRALGSQYEPHWAIKLLYDPRGEDWETLVKPGEYPEIGRFPDEPITRERALGMFDRECPGWVPCWFPRQKVLKRWKHDEERIPVNDEERLAWIDKALARYAQTEWPPVGSLREKQRVVALALLYTLHGMESESIPAPDELQDRQRPDHRRSSARPKWALHSSEGSCPVIREMADLQRHNFGGDPGHDRSR